MQYLSTLLQIANETSSKTKQTPHLASTIGCVLEVTKPFFNEKQFKYLIQVKIIDQTYNKNSDNYHLVKYCSIFLFADKKEEINWINKIGNFIYFHKFLFYKEDGIKLQGKFLGGFDSVYQIHSGEIQDTDSFQIQRKLGRQTSVLDIQIISSRITQMKQWLTTQFKSVFDPFLGNRVVNNFCVFIEPSKMIFKVTITKKNEIQNKLILSDGSENAYNVSLRDFNHILFKQNDWIYIRGIKNISVSFEIVLTQTGSILKLPQLFQEDYRKMSNYQAIYRKTNKSLTEKNNNNDLTYLDIQDGKISSIKQLFDIQDKYRTTIKKDDIILPLNYFIKAVIVKFTGKLKLYHKQYQMIVHNDFLKQISQQQKKQTLNEKKIIYVYEGELTLMDNTVNSKKQFLKVKLFTQDQKSTFFKQKILEKLVQHIGCSDQKQRVKQVQKIIQNKLQKLYKLSTFQNPATLALEPIRSDQLVYRLVHTYLV